ncbi:hypothetical protein N0V82_002612 [Gnomoniopsis sp. IMI 355080]|nr:hypothetical protein N0V82_002612 [Gnomoniopsis sp. IMI 355080]
MKFPYPLKSHLGLPPTGRFKPQDFAIMSAPALRSMPTRKLILVTITLLLLIVYYCPNLYREDLQRIPSTTDRTRTIPRIVHLVQLKSDENAELHFSFQSFLCLYTAYHFIKPDTIFIHTDHSQDSLEHAIDHGSSWTRKVLTAFPNVVKLNSVTPPTVATNGLPIERIEHKSDFVRMEQIAIYGGLYLDWDVVTIRSPTPLLDSGFAAIVGRQVDGNINNGCFMATKDSALVDLMRREMPVEFSGEWQHHSTGLITPIAERISYVPGEVLILDQKAFAPTSWWDDSASALFSEREDSEKPVPVDDQLNVDTLNATDRWYSRAKGREWEIDFSQTYFLHAFKAIWGPVARFDGINLQYILRRKSNYALAVWPVVMEGIREGIIHELDETP